MTKFYLAIINKVVAIDSSGIECSDSYDELSSDDKLNYIPTFEIRFEIPNIVTNLGKSEQMYPKALPLIKHVRELNVGDNVIIIQFDSNLNEFGYLPLDIDNKIMISNGNSSIDLSDQNKIQIRIVDDYKASNPRVFSELNITDKLIELTKYINDSIDSKLSINESELSLSYGSSKINIDKDKVIINNHLKIT